MAKMKIAEPQPELYYLRILTYTVATYFPNTCKINKIIDLDQYTTDYKPVNQRVAELKKISV